MSPQQNGIVTLVIDVIVTVLCLQLPDVAQAFVDGVEYLSLMGQSACCELWDIFLSTILLRLLTTVGFHASFG